MSSFYPTATVVDVNDQQKSVSVADCLKTATADGLTWCLCMYESIVTTADKKNPGVPTTKYLTLGTLCIASTAVFAALERASTLLPWGKATFVNFGAWVYPAMATIAEAGLGAQPEDNGGRNPCAYAGYWVRPATLALLGGNPHEVALTGCKLSAARGAFVESLVLELRCEFFACHTVSLYHH